MIDPPAWPQDASDAEDEGPIAPNRRRRWAIGGMAGLLVVLMLAAPISRLVDIARPPTANNGLAVCAVDYCDVQDAVRQEGLGLEMARLAGIRLERDAAQALVDELMDALDERPVAVEVGASLPGDLAGRYSAATRTIDVEEPIRAWIIIHESAHVTAPGHGPRFLETLFELVRLVAGGQSE